MSIPSFSPWPEIPQRSAPEADFDAKMYALFQHFATTHRAEMLAFIAFLETNSTVIGAALNDTSIGLTVPAAGKFTDVEAPLLVLKNLSSGVEGKIEASASDLNIVTSTDHPIDIRPNDLRSLLLQTNGDKAFYNLAGAVIATLKNSGHLGLGTSSPIRPLHIYHGSDASSNRMRIENGDGWVDLLADDTFFKVTTNVTGGSDTSFLIYDGINRRLGVNVTPSDQLHVHEPSGAASVLRLSNNEGAMQLRLDGGDRLSIRPVSIGADRYDLYEYGRIDILGDATNSNHKLGVYSRNLSFSNNLARIIADRAGGSGFDFLSCFSNDAVSTDLEFRFRGDGNAFADGSWNGGGADYAEFFEWADGNAQGEDRRGISVVLDGARIRPAEAGEDPIGVVSANPSVVGDSDMDRWKDKYLRDDFGSPLFEDYQVVEWDVLKPTQDPVSGAFGGQIVQHQYAADALPEGFTPPEDATWSTQQRRVLNPLWRAGEAYTPRGERAEWDCVGLMGKLRLRKGQPVGARWIKMRDVSATVEEWLVR